MPTVAELIAEAEACCRANRLPEAERWCHEALAGDASSAKAHYLLGTVYHRMGQAQQAVESLSRAVQLEPDRAESHNYLGVVLAQQSRFDEALVSFEQAQSRNPASVEFAVNLRHARAIQENNRGNALAAQGKLVEAVASYRRALELKADYVEAHHNLGTALGELGQLDDAVACHRRAIELRPDFAEAYNNLGAVLVRLDKVDEAVATLRRSIELRGDYCKAHNNLAAALVKQNLLDEAIASCRRAIELQPCFAEAHNTLACVLRDQNQLVEAAACCRRALELQPDYFEARANLASILVKQGHRDEAIDEYQRTLALKPDFAEVHMNLGLIFLDRGEFDAATASWRRALELKPNFANVYHNRGVMLMHQGKADEALASFRKAIEIEPQLFLTHSCALLAAQYQPGVTCAQLAEAHREYDVWQTAALRTTWRPHDNSPQPDRRLRLGFVSPDLRFHPVGNCLVRVLEILDPAEAHATCYNDRFESDAMADRLRAAAGAWRNVRTMNDSQLADQIRADQIDILFDLAGHTDCNRLTMFARKPAPLQITWMGYVGTTGLRSMDYLLADRFEVPEAAEPYIEERVLRMPDDYVCYDPPANAPPVSPLPAIERGYVTFGSFNNPAKITTPVIDLWAAILRQVAGSRLLLKYRWLDIPSVAERLSGMFADRGIDRARVVLLGPSGRDFLRDYQRVDIGLDPFPYSGGVTTCEALWMGVPVVTCPGETFAGRHSLTHLSNVGLTETIAADHEQYIALAVELAHDLPRLSAIRSRLRAQMAGSPLCDGKRFAENLMIILRGVWREWCAEHREADRSRP